MRYPSSLAFPARGHARRWPPLAGLLALCGFSLRLVLAAGDLVETQDPAFRAIALEVPSGGRTGFTALEPCRTGITFSNRLSDRLVARNRILEDGSGVALGDVDGDGWCDIYFCCLDGPNRLYRNLGDWRFQDITRKAGVACGGQFSTGAVLADVDGDGDLDLLVNAIGGGTRLFRNQGPGVFTEDRRSRVAKQFGATSMSLADVDGDGDLDLYVANYRTTTVRDGQDDVEARVMRVKGRLVVEPHGRFRVVKLPENGGISIAERGEFDLFYVNRGDGVFGPVSWDRGAFVDARGRPLKEAPMNWGLSVLLRDLNQDTYPDIYVCNDFFFSPDMVFLSERGRRYRAIEPMAMRSMCLSSMAVDVADINRDGYDDIFVADMLSRDPARRLRQRANIRRVREMKPPVEDPAFRPEIPRNTLFLNRGDNTYAEIAQLSGLDASEWSWCVAFLDVDLDGFEDLLVTTGNFHDVIDADALASIAREKEGRSVEAGLKNLRKFPRLETPNLLFRNRGDLTFEEVGQAWGFATQGVSHGMALGDLDRDGDLDVVVNHLNQPAGVFRNETSKPRIAVRLAGAPPNTHGIGARIRLTQDGFEQSQVIVSGGRYLSGDQAMRCFAVPGTGPVGMEVTWRSGRVSHIENVLPNRLYDVLESGAKTPRPEPKPAVPSQFQDVSQRVGHRHHDAPFSDEERQPWLPRKLSQLGPSIAWFDLDHDGWEDLVIGSGRGGRLAAFRNDQRGGFQAYRGPPVARPLARDLTGLIGIDAPSGHAVIVASSSIYEDGAVAGPALLAYDFDDHKVRELYGAWDAGTGPVAMADIDGDGDLDLFVGGRVVPGKYPLPASSRLLLQQDGAWIEASGPDRWWHGLGLVSGAVFSDIDHDGDPDLLLAMEWGPIRLFSNQNGRLKETTRAWGLDRYRGWWNGINVGDFNGDGRMDIVATNWGRNHPYSRVFGSGIALFYGDWQGDGSVEGVRAFRDAARHQWATWRGLDRLALVLPDLKKRFTSTRQYSVASLKTILGRHWEASQRLRANTLDSMVFLNRGHDFEPIALPIEAQFAPAFGVAVADFDGNGTEDLFLAQNFFDVEPETSRYDAGIGLLLSGNGHGAFDAVTAARSGIRIFGEARAAAVADFDHDGRADLAVGQNRGATKLFQNLGAKPGLRVRLVGPVKNPMAIGARIRLRFGGRFGPCREIHAGSGFWSDDAPVPVLGFETPPDAIEVIWPGGKRTRKKIGGSRTEIVIEAPRE